VTKPAPGPDQPPVPVRLITFNTHHGVGEDARHDLPRLAKVLHSVDADVICLQEVDRYFGERSEDVDQALLLSRALDMQLAWGPAIDEPRVGGGPTAGRRQYGNALLSRLPILVSDVHRLPGGGEPRSALRTMLELDGGTLWVTATHLTTRSVAERAEQVAALAALHTDQMEGGVLVGDFNTDPDAPELAPLRERFTDAWEAAPARESQAGWRFWRGDEGDTFPAHSPRKRIDQVWVSAGVRVVAAQVVEAEGVSDHLPFMVDLEITSGV
jgi:endonuclease/exonuclease/phosphatase family metal-dependent hydrolase